MPEVPDAPSKPAHGGLSSSDSAARLSYVTSFEIEDEAVGNAAP
jgi:hypothetical protein